MICFVILHASALSSRSTDVEGDLCSTLKIIEMVEQGMHDMSVRSYFNLFDDKYLLEMYILNY